MIYGLLADLVVLFHLLFIVFVVCGALLISRWRWLLWLHLPALAWVVVLEWNQLICPLTPLENSLRQAAGQAGYEGSFIAHYLIPIIYPAGLTPTIQWLLGAAALAINVITYHFVIRRIRRCAHG